MPKLLQYTLSACCVIGFLVQVGYISESYFQYKTITRTDMKLQWELNVSVVAFCAKYVDIMDRERLSRETGITIKRSSKATDWKLETSKLTIKQIFEYTPAANDVLTGCSYRHTLQSRLVAKTGATSCNDRFDVRKFYMHDLMCYRFEQKTNRHLWYEKVSNSINSPGTIFHLDLNDTLNGTAIMTIIAFSDRLPFYSRRFAPKLNRMSDYEKQDVASNTYSVLHQTIEAYRLPRPYDTDCDDKIEDSQINCSTDCMLDLFQRKLSRVPYSLIVTNELLEMKHLSSLDLEDEEISRTADEIEDRCSKMCTKLSCFNDYTLTTIYSAFNKSQHSLSIHLMTPYAPTSKSYAEARMPLAEFLTYVFSCFGTWFGISFLSIAPLFKELTARLRCQRETSRVRSIKVYPSRRGNSLRNNASSYHSSRPCQ